MDDMELSGEDAARNAGGAGTVWLPVFPAYGEIEDDGSCQLPGKGSCAGIVLDVLRRHGDGDADALGIQLI